MYFPIIKVFKDTAVVFIAIILVVTMLIPIEFCRTTIPTDSKEEFYIIRYSRSKNKWIILGNKDGLFDEKVLIERFARPTEKGFGISDKLSVDLHMGEDTTTFIVYGTATIDEYWEEYYGDTGDAILYTIDCTGWEILGEIRTMNSLRSIFSRKYLNIYDYRWFDVLRDWLFAYLDGETSF